MVNKADWYRYSKRLALLGLRTTGGLPLNTPWSGMGTIFTLHRIIETPNLLSRFNSILEISIPSLEKHFKYLQKKRYAFLSIEELPELLSKKNPKYKFVIFTFDDGYLDNHTLAQPLFEQYKVPFTVYATNGFVDAKIIIWWYILEDILMQNSSFKFEYKGQVFEYKTATDGEKASCFDNIRNLIIESSTEVQLELTKAIFANYVSDVFEKTRQLGLSWEQLKTMSKSQYITIGGHTINHYALKNLDRDAAIQEITKSRQQLEKCIGKPVQHFAYPFGSPHEVSQRDVDLVKELEFSTAVTTLTGNIHQGHKDLLHSLPRIFLSEAVNQFAINVRLNGIYPILTNQGKKIIGF